MQFYFNFDPKLGGGEGRLIIKSDVALLPGRASVKSLRRSREQTRYLGNLPSNATVEERQIVAATQYHSGTPCAIDFALIAVEIVRRFPKCERGVCPRHQWRTAGEDRRGRSNASCCHLSNNNVTYKKSENEHNLKIAITQLFVSNKYLIKYYLYIYTEK